MSAPARDMAALAADFFARTPGLELAALGASVNRPSLDLAPWGHRVAWLPAEEHLEAAREYLAMNQYAFGPLGLPRWVLADLYLLPGAIGLLRCPARMLAPGLKERLVLAGGEVAIGAAYVGAPSVVPGRFVGVSMLSFINGLQASAWVKSLTLKMLRAEYVRGVTQWDNPAVRVHTRLGPMRLVGRVPGGHEYAERSFVYETDLRDEGAWARAMCRELHLPPTHRVAVTDLPALNALLLDAERGARLSLVPPGLDDGHVLLRLES